MISTRSKSSRRRVPTSRSQIAFALGACGGLARILMPVGADYSVAAADLVPSAERGRVKFRIPLRGSHSLRHCRYSCHYDSPIWQHCGCSAGSRCLPAPTVPRMRRS